MADFQALKADDGHYVCLFPMMYLYCTQTWGAGTFSHGHHQSDWVGPTSEYPYYAPCDLTCYGLTDSGFNWTSTEQVWTPSGLTYVSIQVAHDNDATRAKVGSVVKAGALLGKTGVRGHATGDHVHIDVALAQRAGYTSDYTALANDVNPAQAFYITKNYQVVNTTANGITINFPVYEGGTPQPGPGPEPEPEKKKKSNIWWYLIKHKYY